MTCFWIHPQCFLLCVLYGSNPFISLRKNLSPRRFYADITAITTHETTPMSATNRLNVITSETIETLNHRVSVREYTDKQLDDATIETLLNAARRTSTSSNTQTYSFVVVRDQDTKRKLSVLAGDQQHIVDCPAFVAICADLHRLSRAAAMHGETLVVNLELSLVSIIDAALAGQSLALAAESIGLGIVMIGGMRNQPQEAAELLGLPDNVFVVFGMCLGWPDGTPSQKPRLAPETVIHHEQYRPATDDELSAYDTALAANYRATGRATPDAAWTEVIAKQFRSLQRTFLRAVLEQRGFRLD